MDTEKETLLIRCLDELEAGVSVAEILRRYPEHADEIRPIVTLAARLDQLPATPSPDAEAASREVFLTHARAMKQTARGRRSRRPVWWRRLAGALAVVLLLFVGTLTLFQESVSALPGDPLYSVKRTREDLRLVFSLNATRDEALRQQFNRERLEEIRALLALEREAEVTYRGRIEAMEGARWRVSDLAVTVTDTTLIQGAPQVGKMAEVTGLTGNGRFQAQQIIIEPEGVEDDLPPPVTITPPPTSTPLPTTTSTPAPTPEPSPTPTPAPTTPPAEGETNDDVEAEIEEDEEEMEDQMEEEDDEDDEEGSIDEEEIETEDEEDADDNSGPGSGDEGDDEDDNSGPGSGDDEEDEYEDNSGSGSEDDEDGDDNDNSGSGSDDDEDDDEDNSGSG